MSQAATADIDSKAFLKSLSETFENSGLDFARAYYLFATARLEKTYNSAEIYGKYPMLQDVNTFERLKALYDADPNNEEIKRLFVSTMGSYIANKLATESDELTNQKNALEIDVTGLNITDKDGKLLDKVLYEDTSEFFKRITDKQQREALYERVAKTYTEKITPLFVDLFHQENKLMADLGYKDIVSFYSQSSGHDLKDLANTANDLVKQTETMYSKYIAPYYKTRTGADFKEATRADISYVFHGKSDEMAAIDSRFPEKSLIPLARQTFDGLGLDFSTLAKTVDFKTQDEYLKTVEDTKRPFRILLDVANREGKRSRAYVYPARAPEEIYLSVKPEGGLDDYSAFFHESGHAQHFAYVKPGLSYALALMGNNTVTESYAYLFQNLFLNQDWLINMAGLSEEESAMAIRRAALNDLYMLRRYASKMQFEVNLYDGASLDDKPAVYAKLLTQGTGFKYDAEGWSRDVDAGFYVADYLTAWALEAQLRTYLQDHFGSPDIGGEDWYDSSDAGAFLKGLWAKGNLTQQELSDLLGYNNPADFKPLIKLMELNIAR